MAIYTLHEGLFDIVKDMYKRKALEDEEVRKAKEMIKQHNAEKRARQKSRQTSTPAKNNENKPAFSKEQHDQALELFINLLKKHFPKIIALAKKELNKHPAWRQHCKYATLDFDDVYIADNKFYFNILELDLWDAYPEEARTVAHMDHPESEGFFKAFEKSDAVINAYFATNDLPFKLEPTGDWDDIAEGIAVPIATLVGLASVQESTIFDNVAFLGEGAVIPIALGTAFIGALGLAYAAIYNSDPDVIDNRNIRKALKRYCKEHKDVSVFDRFVSKVSKISIVDLIDSDIIDDKDAKLIRSKPVVAYAIYDRKNNIMAYALFLYELKDGYCYKLCDKSYGNSKEIHNYIKAQFEFATRSYGAGLMSIMTEPPGYMTGGIARRKLTYLDAGRDPYPLSRFEYNKIMSDMLKIGERLEDCLNRIKSKYDNYFDDSIVEIYDVREQRPNSSANPYIIYELLSGEIFDTNDIKHMCNLIKDTLKSIGFGDIEYTYMDMNKEDGKHSIDADNADAYPNISVSIDIYSNGEIIVYVNYSRPIIIK